MKMVQNYVNNKKRNRDDNRNLIMRSIIISIK